MVALPSALAVRACRLQPSRSRTVVSIGRLEAGTGITSVYVLLVSEWTVHSTNRSFGAPVSGRGTAANLASFGVPCEPMGTEHATLEPRTRFPLRWIGTPAYVTSVGVLNESVLAVHEAHDRTARLRLAHFRFRFFAPADLASVAVRLESVFAVLATANGRAFDLPFPQPRLLFLVLLTLTGVASVGSFDEPVGTVHSAGRPIGTVDPLDGTLAYIAPVRVLLEPVGAVHPTDRSECASVSRHRRLQRDWSLRHGGRLCTSADLASVLVPLEPVGTIHGTTGTQVAPLFRPATLANITTVFALLESVLAVHETDRFSGAPVDRLNAFAQVAAACVLLESVWAGHEARRATPACLLRFGTLANVAALLVLLETVWTEHRTHRSQAALVLNGGSLRLHAFTDVAPVRSFLEPI